MKTTNILQLILLCIFTTWYGSGAAEIPKIAIPDVEVNPSLTSVLSLKNSVMPSRSAEENSSSGVDNALPATNGYVLPGGNIIVDNPVEPKCVFYGNYNEGSGDAFQYLDVNTIVFECQ
jgi:hypothetical protein